MTRLFHSNHFSIMSEPLQNRRTLNVEARILSEADGLVEYVASDATLDSYYESILATGWRFDFFQANAPFVDSHNYYSIEAMLGKVVGARIEGEKLIEKVQWAKDIPEHKLATIGWKLTLGGFLKAVSVGFRTVKAVWPGDGGWNAAVAQAKLSPEDAAKCRRIFVEQQQLELSACVIGANPSAVAKAWKAGCVKDADLAGIGFTDDDMTFLKTAGEALERADVDPLLSMVVEREMIRITHRKFSSPTEPKSHSSDKPRGDDLAAREAAKRAEMIRSLEALIRG